MLSLNDISEHLSSYSVAEVAESFVDLAVEATRDRPLLPMRAIFNAADRDHQETWYISVLFFVSADEWSGPWSLRQYEQTVHRVVKDSEIEGWTPYVPRDVFPTFSGFGLTRRVDANAGFADEISEAIEFTSEIVAHATALLEAQAERNTLVAIFEFPESVSTACEQYLLYFVQFLKDLGVEAEASVKHQARQVLFSVTPIDGAGALDNIREALNAYLQIPGSPDFAAAAHANQDIAVQQLQANVLHLHGQLAISAAVFRANRAQIEQLELSNLRYRELLTNEQLLPRIAMVVEEGKSADAESLIPGVVSVLPIEGKGLRIEVPEIVRKLKRRFGVTRNRPPTAK
jgi:hypothetical protein